MTPTADMCTPIPRRSVVLAALAVLLPLAACADDDAGATAVETTADLTTSVTAGPDPLPLPLPPDCPDLECLPCNASAECAGDGCCIVEDPIVSVAIGSASEAVDIVADDLHAVLCGGFGARVNEVGDGISVPVGVAGQRCQHAALGPREADDTRVLWLTHHGDTWVEQASLAAYRIDADGIALVVTLSEPGVLYEGVAAVGEHLYVAAHAGGLRTYALEPDGTPTFLGTTTGFDNATNLAVLADALAVADGVGGLRIVSLKDPAAPTVIASTPTAGLARDVATDGQRLFIALGAGGVDVFDLDDSGTPLAAGHIDGEGTVSAVDVEGDIVALASWQRVVVHDRTSLVRLASQRTRSDFEQDLGVDIVGDTIHVAEWEGHHMLQWFPGRIAPELTLGTELVEFAADVPGSKVVVLRNRGWRDLHVQNLAIEGSGADAYAVDTSSVSALAPGQAAAIEVSFLGDASIPASLVVTSDDTSTADGTVTLPLTAGGGPGIDVGDPLGPEFGFLDPQGLGQVEGLHGNVVVLAYFALF